MGIQIPTIQRNAPQEVQSVGRVDAKVVDAMPAYEMQAKAATHLAESTEKYVNNEIKNTAEIKSQEAANELQTWYETKLHGKDGLAYQKGDPTEGYKALDEEAKKKIDEIKTRSGDYSEMARNAIDSKLNHTYQKVYNSRITLEGKQNADYTTRVTNDSIDLSKKDAIDATANLDISDEHAFVPVDRVINQIKDLRYKEGLKNGTVKETTDPNQIDPYTKQPKVIKVDLDPSVREKMQKDVSDALTLSIDNLQAAGDVEGAQAMLEKYKDELRGPQLNKLEKTVTKAGKDQEAKNVLNNIMSLPEDKARAQIDKIEDYDVREQASRRYDSEMRRRDNTARRQEKTNYSAALKQVISRQTSGNAFQDDVELLDDPVVKRVWDKMNPKQQQALIHTVNQPKDSDQDAKNQAFEKLFNGDFKGMAPEDFAETVGGLNKEDRKMFENQYRKFNVQTPGQEMQEVKYMGSQLTKELQNIGYVKKDQYGKYTNKDQIKINEANSKLIEALDKFPPTASFKEKQDYIKKFAAEAIKGGGAIPEVPKFNGSSKSRDVSPKQINAPAAVVKTPGATVPDDHMKTLKESQDDFKKKFGRWPDLHTSELQDFIKKGGK